MEVTPGVAPIAGEPLLPPSRSVVTTRPLPDKSKQELVEEPCIPEEIMTAPPVTEGSVLDSGASSTVSQASRVIIPPGTDIQRDDASVDLGLVQKGEYLAYDDVQLLNAMMGRVPTSLKLHTVRDAWDAMVRYDLTKTRTKAKQLRALATQAPVGSRGWWLPRDEVERLEHHNALTEMWLTSRNNAPGPEMKRKYRDNADQENR